MLSNSRWDESLPAWSRYLLTGEPLPPPPPPYPVKKFVSIDPFTLDSYAGVYRLAKEGTTVNVVRRRDYLLVDDTSGSPAEMFAETLQDFGMRVGNLQISFHTDENGKVTGLTWYPRGKAAEQSEEAPKYSFARSSPRGVGFPCAQLIRKQSVGFNPAGESNDGPGSMAPFR